MSESDRLDHIEHAFLNFRNGTFQWVDVQRFQLPQAAGDDTALDDTAALAALIAHELFGDNHAGGDPGDDPERHGPYWRDRITPASYQPIRSEDAEQQLRHWAEQHAPLPEALQADMEQQVYQPLRAAGRVYQLRDLGTDAFHDWGGVHSEFHELVLVDRRAGTLTVIVAADD